jgi:cell division protein ZipA
VGSIELEREAAMQDLRIILVIIGALAIAALVIHGLWTNRKNKRVSIKEKPLGRMPDVKSKYRDDPDSVGDGFDEDGIGKVRVVSRRQEPKMPGANTAKQWSRAKVEPELAMAPISADVTGSGDSLEVSDSSADVAPTTAVVKSWSDFYQINIMAREGALIAGEDLLFILKKLGFRYGDMSIFHRHLEPNGQGDVLFSLANMVKPGTFDPARMAQFTSPGVSLFMELPHQGRAEAHFKLMLQAAEKISAELDTLLMDRQRNPLTEDRVEQCLDELRAYDLH